MDKPSILIVGFGTVGHNIYKEIWSDNGPLTVHICDKYKGINKSRDFYDLAFICVDTPYSEENLCDTTEVKNAIKENEAGVYVIKSTVLPGITETLRISLNKSIVFSPEYYGSTQHCNNFDFNFTILGGLRDDCIKVIQILQKVYDATHQFRITDSRTAELVKYMENSYLATKVSFCNQFFDIAEALGVDYEELRELFVLDPRVNPSHTFTYRDKPYWDSHCLNKDVKAIAEAFNAQLLKDVITFNNNRKQNEE